MDNKKAYEKKIQAQVDEWNAEIDKLKAQAVQARADAQINYNNQIEELRRRKETVSEKLAQLKEASEESWEDLKTDIEEGIDLFKSAVKSVITKLR